MSRLPTATWYAQVTRRVGSRPMMVIVYLFKKDRHIVVKQFTTIAGYLVSMLFSITLRMFKLSVKYFQLAFSETLPNLISFDRGDSW